jgi:hypothetical protein
MLTSNDKKQLRENVLRGCKLLDRRRPRWFEQIDLNAFQLRTADYCICGQLDAISRKLDLGHGDWVSGFTRLLGLRESRDWLTRRAEKHGFTSMTGAPEVWSYQEGVWRREITARRRAAAQVAA